MFHSTREAANKIPINGGKNEYDELEVYDCDMCDSGGWTSETEVEVHKHMNHKNALLEKLHSSIENLCKTCMTTFESYSDLRKHYLSEHLLSSEDAIRLEHEVFICHFCATFFFNKKQLTVHIFYYHLRSENLKKRIDCPRCNRSVTTKNLWFHYIHHDIQSVATCRICLFKCKNRKALREHVQTHTKYLFCDICSYQTKKVSFFRDHILSKHTSKVPVKHNTFNLDNYFCPISDHLVKLSKCSNFRGLSLTNNFRVCILCRHVSDREEDMQMHLLEHVKVEKAAVVKYDCVCGEEFSNKVLLKHHIFKLKGDHAPVTSF